MKLKNLNHHAYALIGSKSMKDEVIDSLKNDFQIEAQANPDFFSESFETFNIDDARRLKSIHETKPVTSEGKKIFVISMNGMTVEAQNALLKLLEEPRSYAHFFLVIPSSHLLLPTVRSRLHFLNEIADNSANIEQARRFLNLPKAKRLEKIKHLMDEISKEKKTKQSAIDFLNEVELAVYEEKGVKNGYEALKAIDKARKFSTDRSPSLKILLEFVALSV